MLERFGLHRLSPGARYLLVSVSCFALVNLLVKYLAHLPFQQLVFLRSLVGLAMTFALLRARRTSPWGHNKQMLLTRGLAGTVALTLFFYTLQAMPLATAVTLQYLSPIFTVLLAGLFFGERATKWIWACSILGFAGVWMIQGYDTRVSFLDAAIGLTSAIASGFAYNSVRSLRASDNEWVVILYFQLVTALLIGPWALWTWTWPSLQDWPLILLIGFFTQIAQLFLTKGYQAEKASSIAAINYLGVIYAIAFGVLFFGETLPITTVAGMALILTSVGLTSLRPR